MDKVIKDVPCEVGVEAVTLGAYHKATAVLGTCGGIDGLDPFKFPLGGFKGLKMVMNTIYGNQIAWGDQRGKVGDLKIL
jgi:hypothetical protein